MDILLVLDSEDEDARKKAFSICRSNYLANKSQLLLAERLLAQPNG